MVLEQSGSGFHACASAMASESHHKTPATQFQFERRVSMSSQKSTNRRAFFQDVTAGTAGLAVASALAQLAVPASAQEAKTAAPKSRLPEMPWPTGTKGTKYDKLFCTRFKEKSNLPGVDGPQAYFRGESELPGAGINMGWQLFVRPMKLERTFHKHDVDEYLIFLGASLPDLIGSFDGEIELFLGEELEKHVITKATILYIPRGMQHCPLDVKVLRKPMLFSALMLAPYFNGVYGAEKQFASFAGPATID
jgi:hypothetical protein